MTACRTAFALGLLVCAGGCAAKPPAADWRIAIIAPDTAHLLGAVLGGSEARHAGSLLGRDFSVAFDVATTSKAAASLARRRIDEGAFAIVGGYDAETCHALSALAQRRRVLFVNVGCAGNDLRAPDRSTTLHVAASDAMRREALRATAPSHPDLARHADAVLWHAGLHRFGALQLNQRFQRQFGIPPTGDAWASWMAVKVLWESALATGTTAADSLAAWLRAPTSEFDGHKGVPLRFDPDLGQLLQPLYVVDTTRASLAADTAPPRPGAMPAASVRALASIPASTPLVLVSNEGAGDVTIIDAAAATVVATVPLGYRPRGIHPSPDGRVVLVALSDDAPDRESPGDAVAAIDLARGRVVSVHSAGTDPEQFALSPDGRLLYAANEDAGTVSIVDLPAGRMVASLTVGIEPEGVAASADGKWVYVTAETSNTVSVIDTRRRDVVASFLVGVRPRGAAFAPDGRRAWITNEISGTVSVVDVASHRVLRTIALGQGARPVGVVPAPDGRRVYVATGRGDQVAVIDAVSDRILARVPVGRRPWGLAITPDGRRLYTANGLSNDVSVIDTDRLEVIATLPAGVRPWGVAVIGPRRSGRGAAAGGIGGRP